MRVCVHEQICFVFKIVYYVHNIHIHIQYVLVQHELFFSLLIRSKKKGILYSPAVDTETNTSFEKSFNIIHRDASVGGTIACIYDIENCMLLAMKHRDKMGGSFANKTMTDFRKEVCKVCIEINVVHFIDDDVEVIFW